MRAYSPLCPTAVLVVVLGSLFSASAAGQAIHAHHADAAPRPPTCWSVEGPHKDRDGTYFNAANNCKVPMHCRAWVNAHEPPSQIHLDVGVKGRIDVGPTEADDKLSSDCVEVSPGM